MYNPLLEDLTKLKDADLESKIIDLSRKYSLAARFGYNDVVPQIVVILSAYRDEMNRRQAETLKKASKNSNRDLDGLIKVN